MNSPDNTWYRSTAAPKRLRLIGLPGLLIGAGLLLAALGLSFPAQLDQRIASTGKADALSVAYLKAWLIAQPQDHRARIALAAQVTQLGHYELALIQLDQLAAEALTPNLLRQANEQRLQTLEQAYFSIGTAAGVEQQLKKQAWRNALEGYLVSQARHQAEYDWTQRLWLSALAFEQQQAIELLAPRLRGTDPYAAQVAKTQNTTPPGMPVWADSATGYPKRDAGLEAMWQAVDQAASGKTKQENLKLALRAMMANNQLAAGLQRAEKYLPFVAADEAFWRSMIQLALRASEPRRAQHYARLMLQGYLSEAMKVIARVDAAVVIKVSQTQTKPVNAAPNPAVKPLDKASAVLAFDVFVANKSLDDALALAQYAVRLWPADTTWWQRLVQVAGWNNQPLVALQGQLALARHYDQQALWQGLEKAAAVQGQPDIQIEALRALQRLGPADDQAQRLCEAYERGANNQAARLCYLQTWQDNQQSPFLPALTYLLEQADHAKRVELGDGWLNQHGWHQEIALHTAHANLQLGNQQAVIKLLRRALVVAQHHRQALQTSLTQRVSVPGSNQNLWPWAQVLTDLAKKHGYPALALSALREREKVQPLPANTWRESVELALHVDHRAELEQWVIRAWEQTRQANVISPYVMRLVEAGELAQAEQFLNQHAPDAANMLEQPAVWSIRIQRLQAAGQWGHARQIAQQWLSAAGDSPAAKATWIWQLLGQKDAATLKPLLLQWADTARTDSDLASAFAAAHLALQNPRQALFYLQAGPPPQDSFLRQMALAQTLEALGRTDAAWGIRQKLWGERKSVIAQPGKPASASGDQLQSQAAVASLAMQFASAQQARNLLHNLGQSDAAELQASAKELMLASLSDQGDLAQARAWLLANYADTITRPLWARLMGALHANDSSELKALLASAADWLPQADHLSALQAVGRSEQALVLARKWLGENPENNSLRIKANELEQDQSARMAISAQALDAGLFGGTGLRASWQSDPIRQWRWSVMLDQAQYRSSENTLKPLAQTGDRLLRVGIQWRHEHQAVQVQLSVREHQSTQAGLIVQHRFDRQSLSAVTSFATRQPSDENLLYRLTGQRDWVGSSLSWQPTRDWKLFAQGLWQQLGLQDGPILSRGAGLLVGGRYTLLHSFPSLGVYGQVQIRRFDLNNAGRAQSQLYMAQSQSLLGSLVQPFSANEAIVGVRLGSQSGLGLDPVTVMGWRPQLDLSAGSNSVLGTLWRVSAGLQTDVLGADRLGLWFSRTGVSTSFSQPSSWLDIHYQKHF
jgi:polysaccharide biosynthesis protein PelB